MTLKLNLKQLQFLDAFLKLIGEFSKKKYIPKIVFKEDTQLITGDFFKYNLGYPVVKVRAYRDTYNLYSPVIISEKFMNKYFSDSYYSPIPEQCNNALENLECFIQEHLNDDFFDDLPKYLEEVPPYIYTPTFYGLENFKPSFYILDPEKTYEVVSIILEPSQN